LFDEVEQGARFFPLFFFLRAQEILSLTQSVIA
jgi:hypothetical protein